MIYDIKTNICGVKLYFVNNVLHREDGPAIECTIGYKFWYKNGEYHREDGPAIEYPNGTKGWFLNAKCYGYNDNFTNESGTYYYLNNLLHREDRSSCSTCHWYKRMVAKWSSSSKRPVQLFYLPLVQKNGG